MEHLGYSYHQKMVIWGMIYHWVYYIIQLNMCGTHNNEPSAYYIPINKCIYIYMCVYTYIYIYVYIYIYIHSGKMDLCMCVYV
jgi:hypothetical protein